MFLDIIIRQHFQEKKYGQDSPLNGTQIANFLTEMYAKGTYLGSVNITKKLLLRNKKKVLPFWVEEVILFKTVEHIFR